MLSFSEALKVAKVRALKVDGRSCRSEYWWLALACYLVIILASVLSALAGETLGTVIFYAFLIPIALVLLAAGIRRLHDRNLTGWLMLLNLIPFGGFVLLVLFVLPGTKGSNKFGDDPLTTPGFYDKFLADAAAAGTPSFGDLAAKAKAAAADAKAAATDAAAKLDKKEEAPKADAAAEAPAAPADTPADSDKK